MNSSKPVRVAQIMGKLCAGGVESVVFNYYRKLDHNKIQFDFYYDADSTVEPPKEFIQMGARFIKIPPYQKLPAYLSALRKNFEENDYPIIHSHINTLSVFPLYAAKKEHIPVRIAHNHATSGKGEPQKNFIKSLLRPLSKLYPTELCACSKHAGEWLYGDAEFHVVNNAIELENFSYNEQKRQEVRKELGLENKFVVGHVGRFCYAKNHKFLIDIFHEVHKLRPDAVLLLVGGGELEASVHQKVQKLGLQDCIRFVGIQEDTSRFYQAMDAFVLPSRYEGLGVVLIEAQACSLPIVCSDEVPEEAKVLKSTKFLNLNAPPKVWAENILQVAKDGKRRNTSEELRKAGFDIDTEAKKLEDFYLSLLK